MQKRILASWSAEPLGFTKCAKRYGEYYLRDGGAAELMGSTIWQTATSNAEPRGARPVRGWTYRCVPLNGLRPETKSLHKTYYRSTTVVLA